MAPIGLKLGENTFQTIPDVSFFDVENFYLTIFFSDFSRLHWNTGDVVVGVQALFWIGAWGISRVKMSEAQDISRLEHTKTFSLGHGRSRNWST